MKAKKKGSLDGKVIWAECECLLFDSLVPVISNKTIIQLILLRLFGTGKKKQELFFDKVFGISERQYPKKLCI